MSVAQAPRARVRHSLSGRLRAHVPHVRGIDRQAVERRVGRLPGVRSARANAVTGNVLVHFDPLATDEDALLAHLSDLAETAEQPTPTALPTADSERADLLTGVLKLIGAAAGGLLLLARRLGLWSPAGGRGLALAATAVAVVVSLPPARAALEHVLGPMGAGLLCHLTDLVANVLGGDVLALALQALDAVLQICRSLGHAG